jgi:hypothetical protein
MSERANQDPTTISHGPRWIAIATVCVTGAATLTANGAFLMTVPLILGLIADAAGARRGRWLMWMGAAFLSVTILQMELVIFPEFVTELRSSHKLGGLGPVLFPLWIASILLITWCDVAFVIDAVKARNGRGSFYASFPRTGDWIVWITALLFSVYAFGGTPSLIHAYKHGFDRHDIVLTALGLLVLAIVFDVALIIDATRMRHVQRE